MDKDKQGIGVDSAQRFESEDVMGVFRIQRPPAF
jgi:hypothetical protein